MKLWELDSYFRSEPDKLREVINDPKWHATAEHFREFSELVQRQDRAVLDMELPDELCRQAPALTHRKYIVNKGNLTECRNPPGEQSFEILSALQIFDLYGGACLEEVEEYGSFRVSQPPGKG